MNKRAAVIRCCVVTLLLSSVGGCPTDIKKPSEEKTPQSEHTVPEEDPSLERVTGVMVWPSRFRILVRWSQVTGADGYKIQWRYGADMFDHGRQKEVPRSEEATIDVPRNLRVGTEYAVRVIATRLGSAEGPPSITVTGKLACFSTQGEYTNGNFVGGFFEHRDLSQQNLSSSNFTAASLSGADLSGACGERVDFTRTEMSYANLSDVHFGAYGYANPRLLRVDMQLAVLRGATLDGAFLLAALLREANLMEASLRDAYLVEADLTSANLEFADLQRARLARANVRDASFAGANVTDASFIGTNVTKAQLEEAIGCPSWVAVGARPDRCRR